VKSFVLACLLTTLGVTASAGDTPARPHVLGIAHVRFYYTDEGKSADFYSKILGLTSESADCKVAGRICFPVNATQEIELQRAPAPAPKSWLAEVAFATDDVAGMKRYLSAHGVSTGAMATDADQSKHFEAVDPEGNHIAFIQQHARRAEPAASPNRISTRLFHAGWVVVDNAKEDGFYRGLLGFKMYWHGGFKETDTDWEELQVPDGSDWIEYMLNISPTADHQELGVQNHFSLGVTNIKATRALLTGHGLKTDDQPEVGRDGKWSFDIYDPDLSRVELMEYSPAQEPCCHPYEAAHPHP
jgi:catechol 2,3-dioxygenase-like lactoylglutathione lyase family enzyme